MALDKTKSIQHAIQDGCPSGNYINVTIYKVAAILGFFFQKMQSILN